MRQHARFSQQSLIIWRYTDKRLSIIDPQYDSSFFTTYRNRRAPHGLLDHPVWWLGWGLEVKVCAQMLLSQNINCWMDTDRWFRSEKLKSRPLPWPSAAILRTATPIGLSRLGPVWSPWDTQSANPPIWKSGNLEIWKSSRFSVWSQLDSFLAPVIRFILCAYKLLYYS
jgi:hypothetical protein